MLQSYHARNDLQVTINTQVSCVGASPLVVGIGVIVAGCSNGSFRIYSQSLKEEKLVSGHSSSILGISWALLPSMAVLSYGRVPGQLVGLSHSPLILCWESAGVRMGIL
jgi:hypothetical protein